MAPLGTLGNPPILQRDDHFDAISSSPQNPPSDKHSVAAYILVPVIIGAIVVASLVAFFVVRCFRRKRRSEARRDPNLGEKGFATRRHIRYMSRTDGVPEEEAQRRALIEKSLASRSQRTSQGAAEEQPLAQPAPVPIEDAWHAQPTLDDDLRRERSDSAGRHSLSDNVSELSVPAPTQFRLESPSPLLESGPGEWHGPHATAS